MSFLGSTQKHVPVKPVWPNVSGVASAQVLLASGLPTTGLSKPNPRWLFGLFWVVKISTVEAFSILTPPYVPPLSHIWNNLARSLALLNSPALPCTPPEEYGTAVNVQAMVYGNMGNNSATGVCFSRDAGTGENLFNGEYLINAQGEDVVAGVRTPQQIMTEGSRRWAAMQGISEEERAAKYPSLEESMPECAKQLVDIQQKLEEHYRDMQDMEFTIQDGKLWLLQTRNGKRTGAAMVKIAMDLLREGKIDEKTVIKRYIQTPNLGIISQTQSHFPVFFLISLLFSIKRGLTGLC